ncbi:MAG TPA: bifunctional phosphoribosylaminoimidazolecarboxamide formyltransferase/IMP cyclohydrolase [Gemmatimonadales bacterium]
MPRALLSVSNKTGLSEFGQRLIALGWELVSTGGTAKALSAAGLTVTPIETVTGFPEMLDGRVKTLHPAVHGGLLARRDDPDHMAALKAQGIQPIDMVVVNLYPFRETVARAGTRFEDAIEQIDIGGPSMLRSAAKNHASVLAVVDPSDYPRVLEALEKRSISEDLKLELAAKVFSHTAGYDAAIGHYLGRHSPDLPPTALLVLERVMPLVYGENPNQRAALYATEEPFGLRQLRQRQGKELSFNNLLDIEAGTQALAPWTDRPACVVIKHNTPCGLAVSGAPAEAVRLAVATDRMSAFGSVIVVNTVVDKETVDALGDLRIDVIVAPRFHDEALAGLKSRKNLRIIELPLPDGLPALDYKRVHGGFLVQDRFQYKRDETDWRVATKVSPGDDPWRDLRFAWGAVAAVKSNAILLARHEAAIGIGAGQMSRVDASFLAVHKARAAGHQTAGAVLASDAFFPFPDGVEEAAAGGIIAIIQPGGSVNDAKVIEAADRLGIAMVLTGQRQFRH